ncbi:precorrin-6A reductase [Anaerotignum lactatifermentans]|uniref:Precorrin-6A reductase n=1 Tax=Anaerotignum lactatifermentans TaxID=160404 RepID=A0ABS2GCJ3_9FIRM|nr:precorrin-6A reductase [Anaerotignum lactatifermentans]MBM6829802.1 precorrin-6A reductase [Anaerotignum lactatifermentans]MBM6878258.1 precorrin-6A reductase [Anaerotignum lactatifermentans]MBM6951338.1 precorrin-6A reductase [Anaerotignum lactatifermentans]
MKIAIFGGTTEGRLLSYELAKEGAAVTVLVATEYGAEEQGEMAGIRVLTGRKNTEEMAAILAGQALCVDATHPYALEASGNIRAACEQAGVPYERLLRQESPMAERAVYVADAKAAADYLSGREGNILLTTGTKELPDFGSIERERLFPRVLPMAENLAVCESEGIPRHNIIAMQGPFCRELNEAIMRQFDIRFLVTKDGGRAGGFPEKLRAAERTGVLPVILRRKAERGKSFEEILALCREAIRCGSF